MHRRQRLGAAGEDLAVRWLRAAGLDVVARNWRTSVDGVRGELDIVALDGPTLALIEVRTRRSLAAGSPAESVDGQKRRRLRRLAALYLQSMSHPGPVRGDVVTVHAPIAVDHPTTTVAHLRSVW